LTGHGGRQFGLTAGAALAAFAAINVARGAFGFASWVALAASILVALGLAAPRHLAPLMRASARARRILSIVTVPSAMGIVYFGVVTPVALVRRLFGSNPIVHNADERGYWKARRVGNRRSDLNRQF
jgi:hypothetical protein